MDPSLVSGLSAVLGSIVGGSATLATAWITQRTLSKRELLGNEIRKRELLYGEFIAEASKLALDALDHAIDEPAKILEVYALENRLRLFASDSVIAAAENTISRIIQQYMQPQLTRIELEKIALERPSDPLKPFSEACRRELLDLRRSV